MPRPDRRFLGDFLTEEELATEIRRSTRTLKRWRVQGKGPPYTRIDGKTPLYHVESVRHWLKSGERRQPKAAA